MLKKLMLGATLAVLPLSAANAMDVASFLAKADALEKKGMMALFSSDFKLLKREVETATGQLRAERAAAQKANKPLAYCPPAKTQMGVKDILAGLRSIPAAQRPRMQVKDGLRSVFASRYPCR